MTKIDSDLTGFITTTSVTLLPVGENEKGDEFTVLLCPPCNSQSGFAARIIVKGRSITMPSVDVAKLKVSNTYATTAYFGVNAFKLYKNGVVDDKAYVCY